MRLLFAMILLMLHTCCLHGEEYASIPYQQLAELQRELCEFGNIPASVTRFSVKSALPGMKPADIKLSIEAPRGQLTIPVSPDGQFTLPTREEVKSEESLIVANVPKGQCTISFSFNFAFDKAKAETDGTRLEFEYSDLFPVERIRWAVEKQISKNAKTKSMDYALRLPRTRAVTFRYIGIDPKPEITIVKNGVRTNIEAKSDGIYRIEFDWDQMFKDGKIEMTPVIGWKGTTESFETDSPSQP